MQRTAFILQVHNHPEQVNKFILQLLGSKQADVYVHIDRKSYSDMKDKIVLNSNVKVLEESVDIEWGDISQVEATLLLLKEVVLSGKNYDFVCLRSGQDLLVNDGFKEFLMTSRNNIYMGYRELSHSELGLVKIQWPKIMRKRYANYHPIRILRRVLLTLYSKGINIIPNRNPFPDEYSIYKGSQWFTMPLEVVKYILNFLQENTWYYSFFENTLVPDESFFQTIVMNSHYKTDMVNNNLFYLKWGEALNERNSPQYLRKDDITAIENSNMFFARKFDCKIDNEIVDYFVHNISLKDRELAHS
ncbi:beta-1,6-N-acetylglucosaminyltransferase [Robertmurraya andreesenii]|uniref:Peptide O-xylosyltransferase n=1 Tax=Anoxybacillus andreesenii TaxID=1325932 RepID=A0ABT9V356_9BACL|nr:beta-1,6-N-acetylglucosaminyltransferase [Robertmurraya andreesenii]MDQ0155377.1 hypothetical protein [Robertmurraya andreesenii]